MAPATGFLVAPAPAGDAAPTVLEGVVASVAGGPALAAGTCARHLRLLGAQVEHHDGATRVGRFRLGSDPAAAECEIEISWYGPGGWPVGTPGSEAAVQARSGLMEVHGREAGSPRRLGLEVASVTAGIVAAQGLLAAVVGRSRGIVAAPASTSVLDAALVLLTPYLAMATTPEWVPPPPAALPGPPFPTADGHWVELEALDPEAWRAFWARLDLQGSVVGRGWRSFLARYETATCPLPPELPAATGARPLVELEAVAAASDITLCRLRIPTEVAAEGDGSPWTVRTGTGTVPAGTVSPVDSELPLSGLRVVEATRRLQGPLAGRILGMLGAEVVRVEPPGGDLARGLPPLAGDLGAVFLSLNRGKEAVELDPKRPADRAAVLDLVASADVFLHNWRPGRAHELDLEADDCWAVNPGLVYAQAGGWGPGESRPAVATDFVVQAHASLGHLLRPADEPPFPSRLVVVDLVGALVSAEAVLAGLVQRARTGRGCRVDSSLWSAARTLEAHVLDGVRAGLGDGRPRWGPLDRPLETTDGQLVVTADSDEDLGRLSRVCGAAQATADAVAERLRRQPAPWWEDTLLAAGVVATAVTTDLSSVAHDPRLEPLLEAAGDCFVPVPPWRFRR